MHPDAPLRLRLDGDALTHNWRTLAGLSGRAACGAAVKADGYGLGAREVVRRLAAAGCRDFFVASWAEALAIADVAPSVAVLHGVRQADLATALAAPAHVRPVLDTALQVARWRAAGGGACHVMVDTGINRLGLTPAEAAEVTTGLEIATLLSHLACADEDHPLNARQQAAFAALAGAIPATRYSLSNSAGILLGADYHFDLTRPGLALYGGIPRPEAAAMLRQVVVPEAEVLQRRRIAAGDSVGYNATFTATRDMDLAVLNIGYADGYLRGFSGGQGRALADDVALPVLGRVSMDLLIVDCSAAPEVAEGDWLAIDYRLPEMAAASGLSQYELLTGLGARYERVWC